MARRITPIAVDQPEGGQGLAAHSLAFEGPLDVGPAPDQGDVRAVHPDLGAGRRVWVDIQNSWQVKFKQVLRQQGLDYKAWEHEQREKYDEHFKKLFGEDEKRKDRPNIIASIQRRMHEMMRPSDSEDDGESLNSEDDSDEEGDGDDEEGGEDGSSDDGEGGGAGEEIDLDKEEDKPKKPKRQRCERYEDDFIDDSEIERIKGGPKVKTLYSGFFINKGQIAVVQEPTKQRRRAPKPAAATEAAAAGDGGDAAGSGQPPPAKRRKQQEQQKQKQKQQEQQPKQKQKQKEGGQQQQQQQQEEAPQAAKKRKKPNQGEPAAAAAAGEGSELSDAGGRKKRGRGDATEAAAEGDGAAAAPANKRARKASPATSDAAAAAAPPASQLPPVAGSSAGKQGTAAAALAAALAAASRKHAAAGSTPAAALPPAGPSTARKDAAAAAAVADTGGGERAGTQQQQQQQRRQNSLDPQHQQEKPGRAAAAVLAVFPGGSQPEAAAAASGEAAAAGGDDDGGMPAGLPEDVVAAAMALQKVLQENDAAVNGPTANAASRKVITALLSALGLAFASLPEAQQAQQEAQLLGLVRPLLPHLTDRVLRKKLLAEPRDKLGALTQHREALLAALGDVKGAHGGGDGNASDDDFQQAWSSAAEDSLVAAWTAAKAAGGQASLEHLALEVCAALGNTAVQGQPTKAVAELTQVFRRAQKRHKEARAAEAAAKAAAAGDVDAAGPDGAAAEAAAPAEAAAAAAAGEAKAAAAPRRAGSGQLSPAPSGTAAAAAAATPAGTPAGKQQQQQAGSQDSDAGGEDGAADQPAAEAGTQAGKAEFSKWSAPSPRLERCLSAAKASGASEEWLQEKYTSIRKGSTLGHQTFRILCCAGPAGCEVKDFRGVAEQHSLDCQLDDSAQGRRSLKQAISTKGLSSIVGVTEADTNKVALLAFPGVVSRPAKQPARAATPLQGGQPDGEGAAADAAAAE